MSYVKKSSGKKTLLIVLGLGIVAGLAYAYKKKLMFFAPKVKA